MMRSTSTALRRDAAAAKRRSTQPARANPLGTGLQPAIAGGQLQRAGLLTPGGVLRLQRAVGNRAVGDLLSAARDDRPARDAQPGVAQPAPDAGERASPTGVPEPRSVGRKAAAQRDGTAQRNGTVQRKGAVQREGVVQRRSTQQSVARILRAGISVSNARGALGQLGHAMDVWVEIDAGKHPVTPPNARPNTVYGLELEYWEYVNVPADNRGATGTKPWNDIHGFKPDASTFNTAAPGCDMTWKAAVDAAAAGTLTGKKRIGFRDVPGLYEKPGRDTERTLQFRIVFDDGGARQEFFATQLLRVQDGKLGYSAYRDSTGNALEAHGFGGAGYTAGSATEIGLLSGEANRLQATDLPSSQSVLGAVPAEARQEILAFADEVLKGTAAPYIDLEMGQFVRKVAADRQEGAAADWQSAFSKVFLGDVAGGVAAGQFLIPQIPGTQRRQKELPSGGLLVALVSSNDIKRLYYTDGLAANISMNAVGALQDKNWTINLRSFAEIPIELVQEKLNVLKGVSTAATTKDMAVQGDSTRLRKFTRQGANYIVSVGQKTGPRIKTGKNVAVFDPEVRDVSGDWLKAQYDGTTGFVRASKVAGTKSKQTWAESVKGELTALEGKATMGKLFERYLRRHGHAYDVYARVLTAYPGLEAELNRTYRAVFGEDRYNELLLTKATAAEGFDIAMFDLIATADADDPDQFITEVMKMLEADPGRGDVLESVYNQHIAPGRDVPATLGELVHAHFTKVFRERGDGFAVYNQLLTDYPDFGYRLKPAYRLVFGEDRLQRMLREREAAEAARDVPNPNSPDNVTDFLDFLTHGTFSLADFKPSSSATTGKFDARFDPLSGDLDIIVKVHYRFKDLTTSTPADLSGEQPGFGKEFGRNTWDDAEKTAWKQAYVDAATGPFNSSGRKIACTRPGWGTITATPHFLIQEVALGNQHFIIDATKSVLTAGAGGKALKSAATSGAGKDIINGAEVPTVMLKETDVYDKLQDPRLHTYLHTEEARQNIEPAYLLDRRRLDEALAQHGTIVLGTGKANIQAATRNLADALKRLQIPSSLATLHPIVLTATAARANPRMARAADIVEGILRHLGVANPVEKATAVGSLFGVVASSKPIDPAIQSTYVTNWSRFTAAHEFGHQIGLIDEYYGAASGETIKEMISAGWLPPSTRADHLKLHPPKFPQEAVDQARTMALLRRAGLETPDFAVDTKDDMPKTTSLMTGGFDVNAVHMITAWEALVTMTATHVDEKYWRIT